jgi:hypothetical protein
MNGYDTCVDDVCLADLRRELWRFSGKMVHICYTLKLWLWDMTEQMGLIEYCTSIDIQTYSFARTL